MSGARPRPLAAAALLGAAAAGCASMLGLPPRLPVCEGPLPSTRALPPGDFVLREQVRIEGDEVDVGLLVVAERRGDRLVVVGFDHFGVKAFSLVQEGERVEWESSLGPALPVPPENVLRDLYAARLASGAESPPRVELARPECGYTSTWVTVDRRPLL